MRVTEGVWNLPKHDRVIRARERLMNGLPLATGEVAILAGVHVKTVGNWIRDGKLNAVRSPGGQWLVTASEVRRVITGQPTERVVGP